VLNYETAIKAGKYVLVAHGSVTDVNRAREILATSHAESTQAHNA
jgi:hypothetical protein